MRRSRASSPAAPTSWQPSGSPFGPCRIGRLTAGRPVSDQSVQKAGLRNLVHSLDRTLSADGIRAVSVTVNGTLGRGTPFDPDLVAEAIHAAAHQPEDQWRSEVPYDG